MVSIDQIKLSNQNITSTLPPGLIAVFAGGTNGVGETTLKQFARFTSRPRAYILGRSKVAGERIVAECEEINPDGTFIFLPADLSSMRNVDAICEQIGKKEKRIDILFLTMGTLQSGIETEEGMHFITALTIHARSRMISNFLPLILQSSHLRRVVTIYGAGFEGKIQMQDFQSRKLSRMTEQAHFSSLITLDLLSHQASSERVSFIHAFPGAVESGIARGSIGPLMRTLKTIWGVLGSWVHIPLEEAGERHLFLCTSARFPSAEKGAGDGVPLCGGLEVAKGVGLSGEGVYCIDEMGECVKDKTREMIAEFVERGMVQTVEERIQSDIKDALNSSKR